MQLLECIPSWIYHLITCMGGCFGCSNKPPLVIAEDEPSKGWGQGWFPTKASISDDLWSTSTCEIDNSTLQSQRSLSSISISNHPFDTRDSLGSTSNPTEFVNHGLTLWSQTRRQWLANRTSYQRTKTKQPAISCNESVLITNKPFRCPIPLPEMVDFLVDVWDEEGLYEY